MPVHVERSWQAICINDCFGISSFFILVFLAVAGLKVDACTCGPLVEVVYWLHAFISLVLHILRICFYGSLSGFFHLSGAVCMDTMSVVG